MNIHPQEIAFDFDGVVADTFKLFVKLARENYNYDINYDEIKDYLFLDSISMDRKHALEIIDILTNDLPDIDVRPNEGAGGVLSKMIQTSPLLIVTARPYADPVERWFARHIPEVAPGCLRVEATGANTAKLDVLKGYGVRYFIDDRLDTCFLLQEAGITPIVYTQPWNRAPHPFQTVSNWEDIASIMTM